MSVKWTCAICAISSPWRRRSISAGLAADGRDAAQLIILRRLLGREPNVAYRVASAISVLAIAAAGLALAFVPGTLGHVRVENIQYRPLADFDTPTGLILLSRAAETSGPVAAFVRMARG